MRVLLSALALAALLLMAGAVSVFAADPVPVLDTAVTVDPLEPPSLPGADPAGPVVETVTQAAEPATAPVVETAAPVVAEFADSAAPIAGPIGDAVEPIVDPVVDLMAPVGAPIIDVVEPIADVVDPIVSPIVDVVDPIIGPIVDVVDPVVDPGNDPAPPVTGPGVGVVDAAGLAGVTAPAFNPNRVLSPGVAWFDGDSSIGIPRKHSTSHNLTVVRTGAASAETGASSPGSPGVLPWQGAPFGLPSGGAGPGAARSPGAAIAVLAAWMLAILLIATRRPWSSVPILRGRSLLPALRPA